MFPFYCLTALGNHRLLLYSPPPASETIGKEGGVVVLLLLSASDAFAQLEAGGGASAATLTLPLFPLAAASPSGGRSLNRGALKEKGIPPAS
jgi:hypothetical protein